MGRESFITKVKKEFKLEDGQSFTVKGWDEYYSIENNKLKRWSKWGIDIMDNNTIKKLLEEPKSNITKYRKVDRNPVYTALGIKRYGINC